MKNHEVLLAHWWYKRRQKLIKSRKNFKRSCNQQRPRIVCELYVKLRQDEEAFSKYVGMSVDNFDELLQLIKDKLGKVKSVGHQSLEPASKLLVTLR